jgi:hypothetical protein
VNVPEHHRRPRTALGLAALTLAAGLVAAAAPLAAHHSYAVLYFEDETIEVEGEVLEFQYQNPHSWVHVMAADPFGQRRHYAAEWGGRSSLQDQGIDKDTLRPGDRVRIWASPNRDSKDERIRLKRIERRRDHWEWRQGSRREER